MIRDGYWKKELHFNLLIIQFWKCVGNMLTSKYIEHCIGREMLYSAVAIRKIIEDDKDARSGIRKHKWKEPSFELLKHRIPLIKYPYINEDNYESHRMITCNYDYSKQDNIKMDLDILCNKIIHSYIWSVVYFDKKIYGVIFASDKEKTKEIYLLRIVDWLDTIKYCVDNATV